LIGEVWKRPGLSPRDRSVVTVAALISRNQTVEMPYHFRLALDNGVSRANYRNYFSSRILLRLAQCNGGRMIAKDVFTERGIRVQQLPQYPVAAAGRACGEEKRAARVAQDVGPVSPGLVEYTGALLFHDLWLRPDLAPVIEAWSQ